MVRSFCVTPVAVALAAAGLALGQGSPYVHTAAGEVKEQFVTVQELSKPGQKCKLLKTWFEPGGQKAYLVQSVETGERMTIVESAAVTAGAGSALGAKFRAVSTRIFHWGSGGTPPDGTPLPPDSATVLGRPVEPAAKPATVAAKPARAKDTKTAKAPTPETPAPEPVSPPAAAPAPASSPYSVTSPYAAASRPLATPAAPKGGMTTLVPADFKMAKTAEPAAPKSGSIAALASSKDGAAPADWHQSWATGETTPTMPAGRAEMSAPGSEVFVTKVATPAPAPAKPAKPVAKVTSLPHANPGPADPLADPARFARADDKAAKHWFDRTKGITPASPAPAEAVAEAPPKKEPPARVAAKPSSPYVSTTLSAAVPAPAAPVVNPLPKLTEPAPPVVQTVAVPPAPVPPVVVAEEPVMPAPVQMGVKPRLLSVAKAKAVAVRETPMPVAPPTPAVVVPPGMASVLAASSPQLTGEDVSEGEGNAFTPPPRPVRARRPVATTAVAAVPTFVPPQPPVEIADAFTPGAVPAPVAANAYPNPGMMPQVPQVMPIMVTARAADGVTPLLTTLRDDLHPSSREWAADCLSGCDWRRQPEVVDALAAAARTDPAATVRAGCVRALARMKASTEVAVAAVQALQSDADDHVRQAAAEALPVLTAVRPVSSVMPR